METQEGYLDPKCPRCGYDQSGEAATWEGACPVEGTCPECGHGFGWADLYDPSRMDLGWYVEHARSIRAFVSRSVRTFGAALIPWFFWQRMGVDKRVRPWGLLGWVGLIWFVMHGIASLTISLVIAAGNTGGTWSMTVLVDQLSRMSIRQLGLAWYNGLVWPAAARNGLGIWAKDPKPASLTLYAMPIGFGVMWMILLSVLPTTRRLAKLRLAHAWRAFLVHLGIVTVCFHTMRALEFASDYYWNSNLEVWAAACMLLTMIWSVVWWGCAIQIGWKIESWALFVLGMIAALLGTPVVFFPIVILVQVFNQ